MPAVPECLACGTCCFSRLDTFVRVTGDDHTRLGERGDALVWFDGNRAFMRMEGGHCAALLVDVAARRFVCSVYEQRPQACRDLERGSPACLAELEQKRDRPLVALGRTVGPTASRRT